MNVLAINFSAKKTEGNTHRILTPLLEGMESANANVEYLHAFDYRIERCQGCFHCHYQTLGVCRLADDLTNVLLDKAKVADYWVFGLPIYNDTSPGIFNDTLLRLIMPLVQPYIERIDGYYRHPLRYERAPHGVVFVATSGYPDSDRYALLWQQLENVCLFRSNLFNFKGVVYRPSGPVFSHLLKMKEARALAIQSAARCAGEELVHQGNISEVSLAEIRQPLINEETLVHDGNEVIRKMLAALPR